MEHSFSRVKNIIERLRDVLKCQKCTEMKKEDSMIFYNVCDHFYCSDCLSNEQSCPLCNNPLDKPKNVVNDTNILSLYLSLAKFELPSRAEIEKIYKGHTDETVKENGKVEDNKQDYIKATPKNQRRSRFLAKTKQEPEKQNKKEMLISSEVGETILVSSGENESNNSPVGVYIRNEHPSTSGRGRKTGTPANRGRSAAGSANTTPSGRGRSSTPAGRGRSTTPSTARQNTTPLINSVVSSKGNSSTKTNINKRNPKGETQLHLACKKSNFKVMSELIAAGANPNAQDNAGWTPLHDSVFSGNLEVIKFLLENGAKVNAPGLENTTALHEAIAKGNISTVKLLLEYGADINAMNIFKETPLDLVSKYKLDQMKQLLLDASNNSKKSSVEIDDQDQKFIIYKYNLSVEDEKLVNKFVEKFDGDIIPSLMCTTAPTHIVVPHGKVELEWALISTVLKGCFAVTTNWIKDSMKENTPKPASSYEPPTLSFSGFAKARGNKCNQLPGLFSGCHFFFGGNFENYSFKSTTVRKEDLKNLVEKNGGAIVKRCPDPESLALEKTIPFHAPATSSLRETSYFIIYQTEKWDPKPKYNMSHMKTLPVEWLLGCILTFELIDPNNKEKSWESLF